jgi:hypothetical protein
LVPDATSYTTLEGIATEWLDGGHGALMGYIGND